MSLLFGWFFFLYFLCSASLWCEGKKWRLTSQNSQLTALILNINLSLQEVSVILINIEVSSVSLYWVLCFIVYSFEGNVKKTLWIDKFWSGSTFWKCHENYGARPLVWLFVLCYAREKGVISKKYAVQNFTKEMYCHCCM